MKLELSEGTGSFVKNYYAAETLLRFGEISTSLGQVVGAASGGTVEGDRI
jgi:hypothetical protein